MFPQKYVARSKAPPLLLLQVTPGDHLFPVEAQDKGDEILTGFASGYKREYYDGYGHGFAIRGDLSNPTVKAAKEATFKSAIECFFKYV